MESLVDLNIGGLQLTGTIPASIGSLSSLSTLVLVDNQLTGDVPESLCDVPLTQLNLDGMSGTLGCYAKCLTEVPGTDFSALSRCQDAQDVAICGFIHASNIATRPGYEMWQCTNSDLTSTDPCSATRWEGIDCTGNDVSTFQLFNLSLVGTTLLL